MAPEEAPDGSTDAPFAGILGFLFFATSTVLVLTEHFHVLPGALAAFASARYIVSR